MAPPKRYWVKLNVPSTFLSTLPNFPPPVSKSRLKKIAAEEKKTTGNTASGSASTSKASSPTPVSADNQNPANNHASAPAISNFKINSGLKESSTSGLTMNSISNGLYALDKSGKPCKKWVKKPTQFKTFSGFKVKYVTYKQKDQGRKESKASIAAAAAASKKEEEKIAENDKAKPPLAPKVEASA